MVNWRVKLFEASVDPRGAATPIDTFGVTTEKKDHDQAKRVAQKWLTDRGHTVRSISFSGTETNMVAYVKPKAQAQK